MKNNTRLTAAQRMERDVAAMVDVPGNWGGLINTPDLYLSQFVQAIEAQESFSDKVAAGNIKGLKEPTNLAARVTGVHTFPKLCAMALDGRVRPWVPTTFATGLSRRAQLAINLKVAASQLSLTKTSPWVFDMCVQIMNKNIKALGPRGHMHFPTKVPIYAKATAAHNAKTYAKISGTECRNPVDYMFFCCFFSYPIPGDGNRSVYSTFVAASVAMAFFKTDQTQGPAFLRAKNESMLELLKMFAE